MKALSRPALLVAATLALAACNKKTTSEEVPHPNGTSEAPAPADGGNASPAAVAADSTGPAAAPATSTAPAKPGQDPLAGLLSNEEIARYDAWFKKYNIPFDAGTLDQDTDGDGYTNRQEFDAGTNPRDPRSVPGVMEGVSVKVVNEVQVPLLLENVDQKGTTATIKHTADGSVEKIGEGAQPRGLPYKVARVKHEIKADKHGELVDASSVTLENSATKETVTLVRDLPARSSETHAVLVGADGTEQKVRIGDVITLPGQGAKKFTVLDLRADQVLVEDSETKKPITIPKR
jgi:hypothetical protein